MEMRSLVILMTEKGEKEMTRLEFQVTYIDPRESDDPERIRTRNFLQLYVAWNFVNGINGIGGIAEDPVPVRYAED